MFLLWKEYSDELAGPSNTHLLQRQRDKLINQIRQYHLCRHELLAADRRWLMTDPEPFFQKARLASLKNWLRIYEPVLLEGFRLANAAETRRTRPLTSYFRCQNTDNLPARRSHHRIKHRLSGCHSPFPSRSRPSRPSFSRPIASYFV